MFKKLHPVYKAMQRVASYCAKRMICKGCLFSVDGDCILQDRDKIPADWVVPRKEGKHE